MVFDWNCCVSTVRRPREVAIFIWHSFSEIVECECEWFFRFFSTSRLENGPNQRWWQFEVNFLLQASDILGWPTWLVGQLFDTFDTENESMKALEWVLRAVRIFSSASLHRNEAEGDERRGDWRGRNRLAWKPHRPLGRFRSNQSWTRRFNEPTDQRWSQGGHTSRRRRTSGAQTKGCQPFSRHLIGWLRCKLANPLINWRLAKTTSRSPVAARHLGSNAISL